MKRIIFISFLILLTGCSELFYSDTDNPAKIVAQLNQDLDAKGRSTIGRTRQELLLNWGPPVSKTSDGNNGEIFTYSVSAPFSFGLYTGITNLYINEKGVIYHSKFIYTIKCLFRTN